MLVADDIKLMLATIDACVERGAFKGNEIYVVGQLREKLVAVISAAQQEEAKVADAQVKEQTA